MGPHKGPHVVILPRICICIQRSREIASMHFELSASWNSSKALSQRQVLVEKKSVFPLTLNYERKLRMSKRDRDSQESTMADGDLNEEELLGNFSSMQLKRRTFCPIHFLSTNRQLLPLSRQNRSPR